MIRTSETQYSSAQPRPLVSEARCLRGTGVPSLPFTSGSDVTPIHQDITTQRVARICGAPFASIRRQLGANRAAISGGYTRISPAAVPSEASLAHAGYANVTGTAG